VTGGILYLSRPQVALALREVDIVEAIRDVLV
jgi:hypothetical protein